MSSTALNPVYYEIHSYNRNGVLTDEDGVLKHVNLTSANGLWRIESGVDGAMFIINAGTGKYLTNTGTSDTKTAMYLHENGVNDYGWAISSELTLSGWTCIDANNQNNGCGKYMPYSNDWQGTSWVFKPIALSDGETPQQYAEKYAADNYITSGKYYVIASYNRGGYLTAVDPDSNENEPLAHIGMTTSSVWKFITGSGTNGFVIQNYADPTKFLIRTGISNESSNIYVSPHMHGNFEGKVKYAISSTAPNGVGMHNDTGNSIDANNNNIYVGTWGPRETDWQGTSWIIYQVEPAEGETIEDWVAANANIHANESVKLYARESYAHARANLVGLHGSETQFNTPGYVPVSVSGMTELCTAVTDAKAAFNTEGTNFVTLKNTLEAAIAAAPTDNSSATADISAGALYRIVNTDNRGIMYSKADSPYVYSTRKEAYAGADTDDCMLWGVAEEKSQDGTVSNLFLYNAGRKAFIYHVNVPDGYRGTGWAFECGSYPAYIDITENQSKFPVVEILGHTTDAIHMGISINYPAPLIHYYSAADGGVKFRFEYVRPDSEAVGQEVFNAFATTAESRIIGIGNTVRLSHEKAQENDDWTVGFRSEEVYATMETLLARHGAQSFTYGRDFSAIDLGFTTWWYAPRQMPEHDAVYTIEAIHGENTHHLYNNDGILAIHANAPAADVNAPKYRWHVQKSGDLYTFSNYREVAANQPQAEMIAMVSDDSDEAATLLNTTQLSAPNAEGAFTIEATAASASTANYGYVTLKQGEKYLATVDEEGTPTFVATNAEGASLFRLVNAGIGASSATTAIDEITISERSNDAIYDLQGRRLAAPTRGINIIGGRKVLVK